MQYNQLLKGYPYRYVKNEKKKSLNTRKKTEECTLDFTSFLSRTGSGKDQKQSKRPCN